MGNNLIFNLSYKIAYELSAHTVHAEKGKTKKYTYNISYYIEQLFLIQLFMQLSSLQNHHSCKFYLFSNDLFIDVIGKHRTWAKYWTIHWGHHSCRNCSKTLKITYGIHVKYCRLILQYRWYKKTILYKFYFIVVENCCKLSKLTLVSYKEHACNFQSKITVI